MVKWFTASFEPITIIAKLFFLDFTTSIISSCFLKISFNWISEKSLSPSSLHVHNALIVVSSSDEISEANRNDLTNFQAWHIIDQCDPQLLVFFPSNKFHLLFLNPNVLSIFYHILRSLFGDVALSFTASCHKWHVVCCHWVFRKLVTTSEIPQLCS